MLQVHCDSHLPTDKPVHFDENVAESRKNTVYAIRLRELFRMAGRWAERVEFGPRFSNLSE